jgi:hypothetical protein
MRGGIGMATRTCGCHRRKTALPDPGLDGPVRDWRIRNRDHERGARRFQCEGEARTGMEAGLVKLEAVVPEGTGRVKSRLTGRARVCRRKSVFARTYARAAESRSEAVTRCSRNRFSMGLRASTSASRKYRQAISCLPRRSSNSPMAAG